MSNSTGPNQPQFQSPVGRLVVISGPSGVGKTTVLQQLMETCPLPLQISVSATTRPPRPGEVPGVSYHFLSEDEFQHKRERDEFLECVEVFGRGHWYGTLRDSVYTNLKAGNWVILEIDVVGASDVIQKHPDALSIFIHPGSMDELERRLRNRGTEEEASLQRRLEVARQELAAASQYQYRVINQSVEQTVSEICQLLKDEEQSACMMN